jgi:ATP-dependent Clp protease protease subunit
MDKKADPIDIIISSDGGDVYYSIGIYELIKNAKCQINTYCLGIAASAAVLPLVAGTIGNRHAFKQSTIMMHGIKETEISDSNLRAMEEMLKEFNRIHKIYCKIISSNTKLHYNTLDKMLREGNDIYLSPVRALKLGFIDKII